MKEKVLSGTQLKDSGRRRKFSTGAVRDFAAGKGRFDLLPPRAMREVAIHYEQGAVKYGENNYLKGIKLSVFLDSGIRHAFKILGGEHDERHDRAAAWNMLAFLETAERIREGILPKKLDDIGWIDAKNRTRQ
jgi:hypothetical protein